MLCIFLSGSNDSELGHWRMTHHIHGTETKCLIPGWSPGALPLITDALVSLSETEEPSLRALPKLLQQEP